MARPALLTIDQAAEQLGTTVRHMRRLVDGRRITFVKVGGKVRFDPRALDAYVEANTVSARR